MTQSSCIFCKIIAKEIPSTVIFQDDQALVIKDINPKASIHYLILPKQHISDIRDLQPEDKDLAGHLLLVAQTIALRENPSLDFKLTINNGPQAGQVVFHLHVHFLAGQRFGAV